MTAEVTLIPLAAIKAEALPRDRTAVEPEAVAELQASILASGLCRPIEVFAAAHGPDDRFSRIPAFVRRPADVAEGRCQRKFA